MSEQARRTRRFPASQGLALKCDSWAEFVQFYASDISQGGLFIVTAEALPILSSVEVRLNLPEGHQVVLPARVVHTLDRETAERDGKEPGLGVEFVNLDDTQRAHIHDLIEFARWEGAAGTGTYASHMFERSPSHQTLDEVVLSLPPVRSPSEPAQPESAQPESMPAATAAAAAATDSPPRRRKRRRRPDDGTRRTGEFPTGDGEGASEQPIAEPSKPPAKPSDPLRLKEAMTHFAHRRYDEAIAGFRAMDADNPGDAEANKWMCVAMARVALARKDDAAAIGHYEKALEFDEDNHEARRFLREHHRNRRLVGIPFGRYFRRSSQD